MAIAKGRESAEAQEFKRYTGVAPVFIAAINPNKAEHEKLFNTTLEEAPTYVGTKEDNEGNTVQTARISIVLRPDIEKIGFDMPLVSMALFLENRVRYNGTHTKVQVVDKYGNFGWPSLEEAEVHATTLKNKKGEDYDSHLDKDYRPAYVGEEELMAFVKTYLNIPNRLSYDNNTKTWGINTKVDASECECRFDDLSKVFKGDFTDVKDALGYQPTNKVKVLLGVRTDPNSGKLYQSVYTRKFLSNAATNYSNLDSEIQDMIANAAANGRTLSTVYEVSDVHEYSVEATKFNAPATDPAPSGDMPFDAPADGAAPWETQA